MIAAAEPLLTHLIQWHGPSRKALRKNRFGMSPLLAKFVPQEWIVLRMTPLHGVLIPAGDNFTTNTGE
jgi:hypothetical protein